ncbi:MAG: ParA family protein [Anaerolineales bacterium]|nr:ParA family protein [Anaerolineales bacterium]
MAVFAERKSRLHRSVLGIVNLKGGVGKTILSTNLAAIAAKVRKWKIILVDLDNNIPLTRLALDDLRGHHTVLSVLQGMKQGRQLTEANFTFIQSLGVWLLPGSPRSLGDEEVAQIPRLLAAIKSTYFAGGYVDLVIVDPPGGNRAVNGAVLLGSDNVCMPISVAGTDLMATNLTVNFIKQIQQTNGGRPHFLGFIPNRLKRKDALERSLIETIFKSELVLPYVPESNYIRKSLVTEGSGGGSVPVHFAPKSMATEKLIRLFNALDEPNPNRRRYELEIRDYLGMDIAGNEDAINNNLELQTGGEALPIVSAPEEIHA